MTIIWVVTFGGIIHLNFSDAVAMSLNEWGDFVAGAASPLALLWVVLGYRQHGEELRLNTEALKLQQVELQRQVEETEQLVKAANMQAQTMQTDLKERQSRDAREAAPEFVSDGVSSSSEGITVTIRNRGGEARKVKLHYDGPYQYRFSRTDLLESNSTAKLVFEQKHNPPLQVPLTFRISCIDRLGHEHNSQFTLSEDLDLVLKA